MSLARFRELPILLALAVSVAACDDSDSPTEPVEEEEVVEVARVTVTFSGTLELGQNSCHSFSTTETGDIDLTIVGLEPLDTLTVGMGLGDVDETIDSGCSVFAQDTSVRLGNLLQSASLVAASYCVCVFDVGNIFAAETVTYTVQVTHP